MNLFITLSISAISSTITIAQSSDSIKKVMNGFPPSRESQVSLQNYREHPFRRWSFRNPGAPLHVLMLPRSGNMHPI